VLRRHPTYSKSEVILWKWDRVVYFKIKIMIEFICFLGLALGISWGFIHDWHKPKRKRYYEEIVLVTESYVYLNGKRYFKSEITLKRVYDNGKPSKYVWDNFMYPA